MNQHLMNRFIVGVLVVVALAGLSYAIDKKDVQKVQNVLTKLDAYAFGKREPGQELTTQELEEAFAEFESWDSKTRKHLIRVKPLMQLLIDFLFYPMERFHDLIGDTAEEHAAYVKRLEENYKRFRPSYLGRFVGNKLAPNPKTFALLSSLFGINKPKPLTMKMLREAKQEFDAFTAKIREIPDFEDVYAALDELMRYRNYYNQPEVKGLEEIVFPSMINLRENQLPALQQLYVEEMAKKNIVVQDGQLVNMVYTH